MWERLTSSNLLDEGYDNTKYKMKLIGAVGIVLQLTSVIILSTINCEAVGESKLKLNFVNFHDLKLGTAEDVDAMVQILATFSTSYNWLVTCCVSAITVLHVKI